MMDPTERPVQVVIMTTSSEYILITRATGNVGRELVKLLHRQGQPIRAAASSCRI